jgi:hypothetical protein
VIAGAFGATVSTLYATVWAAHWPLGTAAPQANGPVAVVVP